MHSGHKNQTKMIKKTPNNKTKEISNNNIFITKTKTKCLQKQNIFKEHVNLKNLHIYNNNISSSTTPGPTPSPGLNLNESHPGSQQQQQQQQQQYVNQMMAQQQQHQQQQLNQQQNGQIKFSPPGNIQQMLLVNQDLVDNDENFNQTSPIMNIQQQSPTAQYMQTSIK
jgi:hypothetical protein